MKKTIKRQIAEFVASKGSATRMEIIEFYVDLKNGKGHYQENKNSPLWIGSKKDENGIHQAIFHPTQTHNPFRGRLSSGFNKIYEEWQIEYYAKSGYKGSIRKAWLMDENTREFLVKDQDGKYQAVIKD
jgi:hypothetical protein